MFLSFQALIIIICCFVLNYANEDAKRLFEDLMRDYNKLRRPIENPQDKVTIHLKLRLSQIIDVHEKDQIMITSVWLNQEWKDPKLKWNTSQYGGINVLYIPAEMLWIPDIVLYNNADSNYNITITTKATVHWNGTVHWHPPAVYKSMCQMNVEWFPFDDQLCHLKFGSWTYDWKLLDLKHLDNNITYIVERNEHTHLENVSLLWKGIDLTDYYPSVEWDILEVPAKRHNRHYQSCCPDIDSFVDITYYITLRRKPLFYTVNLIIPCVAISFLTVLVFYLPSDSRQKIALSISIFVSLTVFFLLLTEIIPATSIVVPLIGKYLLFTMTMVSLSVAITVITVNVHFRDSTTHKMPGWIKLIFMQILPKLLFMKRPKKRDQESNRVNFQISKLATERKAEELTENEEEAEPMLRQRRNNEKPHSSIMPRSNFRGGRQTESELVLENILRLPQILKCFENVNLIATMLEREEANKKIIEDWKYVAMVIDRLFLWIFSLACILGTAIIILRAPAFHDNRVPLRLK